MGVAIRHHRGLAVVVLVAMLWASLSTLVSPGLVLAAPASVAQALQLPLVICHASDRAAAPADTVVVAVALAQPATGLLASDDPGPAAPHTPSGRHCPWCPVHGHAVSLPVAAADAPPPPALGHAVPARHFQAAHPQPVWPSARSRAPPALA